MRNRTEYQVDYQELGERIGEGILWATVLVTVALLVCTLWSEPRDLEAEREREKLTA